LNVSKKISAAFSLFRLGLRGASVSNTGCCKKEGAQSIYKQTIIWQLINITYHKQHKDEKLLNYSCLEYSKSAQNVTHSHLT
jgi:hypothetical protein